MYGDKLIANEQLNNFTYLTRQILEISGKKSIPIADEIEILTKYLELEQLRFKKDFTYSINVSDKIDEDFHKIPPMLIQPIIENIIRDFDSELKRKHLTISLAAIEVNALCDSEKLYEVISNIIDNAIKYT
jgi:LytS/YehU family sensor histidine kinase